MEVAKEAGVLLSYDPNLRLDLWPSAEEARTQIMSIWDRADVIKISNVELEFLTGCDRVDDGVVMTLWRPELKLLLVTLGANGCRYYTKVKLQFSYYVINICAYMGTQMNIALIFGCSPPSNCRIS